MGWSSKRISNIKDLKREIGHRSKVASPSVHIRPKGPDKLLPSQGAQHNCNNLHLEALAHKVLHMMMLQHWIGKYLINSPAPQLSPKFIKQVIICFDVLNGGVGGEVCSPQDPSLAGCEWTKTAKKTILPGSPWNHPRRHGIRQNRTSSKPKNTFKGKA